MDWVEALELVVSRTRHEAYRLACAESHPAHIVWRSRMVAMATGLPAQPPPHPDRPSVAQSWDLTRAMHACPYRSIRPGCCAGARCALRKGDVVSYPDCFACLKRYG